ncbi:MAG: isocitrate lyase/phosphoenolpyruvate mutase family protein [Vicinamibacterales bacterium]
MPSASVARFRELHASGCFVLPNPWDAGSARALVSCGFLAVATTSSGMAWSRGRADNQAPLEEVLAHLRDVAAAVDVPVNADFEGGFAVKAEDVAANVARALDTGIAGISIEDSTGHPEAPLFDAALALDRIRAARAAIDTSGTGVLLTARTEGFICGRPDLDETVRRLAAFAEAGADCLYAPGIRTREEIETIVQAVAPKPVNVLAIDPTMTVAGLAALGVRRISVGGALARTAWTGFLAAARAIAADGSFAPLGLAVTGAEMNRLFSGR